MIICSKEIEIPYGGEFNIVAFGDVHYGAANCHKKRFEQMVIAENAKDPNTYFLDLGDTLDCIGPKDYRYRPHEIDPELLQHEDFVDKQIEGYVKIWEKYDIPKERWIGMVTGNHHDSIRKYHGTDVTERLCYRLGGRNLGWESFVRLQVKIKGNTRRFSTVLFCNHGFGGGKKDGAAVNSMTDFAFRHPGASVYLFGHNHRLWHHGVATCEPNWRHHEQADSKIHIGNTGTFLKTKGKGTVGSYSQTAGYYPTMLGCLKLRYKHNEHSKKENGRTKSYSYLDISITE